uniref:F-box domain-containing protein n=1 Tax=Cannabis sativa TaxID=3483 RepID=A0A803P650_CANSA
MAKKRTRTIEEVDRISKLPKEVITHILSFLPTKDAVRTCVLSKHWKLMWYYVPKLFFPTANTNGTSDWRKEFFDFVDKCLERRKNFIPESTVISFEIQMGFLEKSLVGHIDEWLDFAVENKVKQIKLCLALGRCESNKIYYYPLPEKLVLKGRYLTKLELSKVELDSNYSFDFPSLKLLSLCFVWFKNNDVVDKLLLGCPSLENLKLSKCCGLIRGGLRFRSLSLKFLQIESHSDILVQIEAMNLESLELYCFSFEKMNLSLGKVMRNLVLVCDWGMKESLLLENLISNLPQLENLTLCDSKVLQLKNLKILNHHLKSLKLRFSNITLEDEPKVIVEASKLESFCYEGNMKHSVSIVSSNLLNGKFIILNQSKNYDTNWFVGMMNFFAKLNCSWNKVNLHIDSEKVCF